MLVTMHQQNTSLKKMHKMPVRTDAISKGKANRDASFISVYCSCMIFIDK